MTTNQKSAGLGGAVVEFPQGQGTKRTQTTPTEPEQPQAKQLNLLQHLPDGDFKQYVGDVAKMCNIHPSTTLLVGLGIVSSVACRSFAVAYQNGDLLPVGEYVICGGLPGDAKSRELKAFQFPIFKAQKAANKEYLALKKAHKDDPRPLAEKGKFDAPKPPRIFITDTTTEALEPILAESEGYFSLASAEQAVVNTLVGAIYGGEGKKNNNDLPLKGFNAEYHASSRSRRDGYTGVVVGSITCFSQPAAIETILSKSDDSGLAERFLLVQEPTQQGYRDHTKQHYPNEYSQNVYNRIVGELADKALSVSCDFEDLPAYRIADSDWLRIQLFRNEIEPHLRNGGKYSTVTMRGIGSKVDMHIMKIAALLAHLYDYAVGAIPSQFIDAAMGIMAEMLEYTLSLLVKIGVIGFDSEEDCVIAYLGEKRTATRRQIQQAKAKVKPFKECPKPNEAIRQTIDRLISKGVVSESEEYDSSGNNKGKLLRLVA